MEVLSTTESAQDFISGLVLAKPDKKFIASYVEALNEGMNPARHETREQEIHNLQHNLDSFKLFSETCDNAVGTDNFCREDMFWLTKQDLFIGYISLRTQMGSLRQKFGGNTGRELRPTQRGKGYGTISLQLTKLIAENRGYEYLEMVTAFDNMAAIRPWQKCDAVHVETLQETPKSYYPGAAVKYRIDLKRGN